MAQIDDGIDDGFEDDVTIVTEHWVTRSRHSCQGKSPAPKGAMCG